MTAPRKAYAVVWLPDDSVTQYIAAHTRPAATAHAYQSVCKAYDAPAWRFRTRRAPAFDAAAAAVQIPAGPVSIGWHDHASKERVSCCEQKELG